MRRLIAIFAGLVLAGPAAGQPPQETLAVVQELVVRAYGGPPWWTVSKGDSKVYVLALAHAVPKGHGWDQTLLNKRLTGAKRLILPLEYPRPGGRLNARNFQASVTGTVKQPAAPSAVFRARFAAQREAFGKPESRYAVLPPGSAAMLLAGDAYAAWDLPVEAPSGDEVLPVILAAARAKRVGTEKPNYSGPPLRIDETLAEMLGVNEACAAAVLDQLNEGPPYKISADDLRRVQRAWADGDIRPILPLVAIQEREAQSPWIRNGDQTFILPAGAWARCAPQMPGTRARVSQYSAVKDTTAAIARQLRTRGHAVAVVGPYALLSRDGVLDRLRRQGFTVTTPATQNQD